MVGLLTGAAHRAVSNMARAWAAPDQNFVWGGEGVRLGVRFGPARPIAFCCGGTRLGMLRPLVVWCITWMKHSHVRVGEEMPTETLYHKHHVIVLLILATSFTHSC
jgi:hypothetical protein